MCDKYKEATDEGLMIAFAHKNDMKSFNELYLRYDKQLVRFVSIRIGMRYIAQDICQEAWQALIQNKSSYKPTAKFKTFIFHIVHNKLIDYYRKQNINPLNMASNIHESVEISGQNIPLVDERITSDPFEQCNQQQIISILDATMNQLSHEDKELLVLRYSLQMSVPEIARVLEISKEAAKSRVRYAKKRLYYLCMQQKTEFLSMLCEA